MLRFLNSSALILYAILCISVLCTAASEAASAADAPDTPRVWTDRLGREIKASWDLEREKELQEQQTEETFEYPLPLTVEKDGEMKTYTIPSEKLSAEDRDFILEFRKNTENAENEESAEEDPFAEAPLPGEKKSSVRGSKSKVVKKSAKTGVKSGTKSGKKPRLAKPKGGDEWILTVNEVKFRFRYCPQGVLTVPAAGNRAARFPVSEGFWMLETEVTQEQWEAIMGENPAHFQSDETRPVEQVSWYDANMFCAKISAELKTEAFLPTALQWTYASCGGEPVMTAQMNLITKAWLKSNSAGKTHAAAQLTPNKWGLYDMYGNVWEWCRECRDARLQQVAPGAPERKETSALHCGGSWYGEAPELGKETWRDADQKIFDVGFRFCVSDEIRTISE